MSVLGQLLRDTGEQSASPAVVQDDSEVEVQDEVTGSPEGDSEKTAAAREVLADVPDLERFCAETAATFRDGIEKTASEGGDVSEAEQNAEFFEKMATTLHVQRVYSEAVVKQAAESAKLVEALKLASDMLSSGHLDVPEGQTMYDVVCNLAAKDLRVVKAASEMFGEAVANALGEAEKRGSEQPEKLDGSWKSWAEAHTWLTN